MKSLRDIGISLERRKRLARIAKRYGSNVQDWWIHFDSICLDDPDLVFGFWLDGSWHSTPISSAGATFARCTEAFLPL